MKSLMYTLLLISFMCTNALSQGINNDFDFDRQDFEYLFNKLGYGVFKFPITQSKEEVYDIIVEVYREGQLESKHTAIENAKEAFEDLGIDVLNYVKPDLDDNTTDSVFLHRFYTERKDSLLTINIQTHGLTTPVKLNISDLSSGDVRATYGSKEEIEEDGHMTIKDKTMLLYFYANKDQDQPLWCPAGLSAEQIAKKFYYAAFVYVDRVK